MGQNGRVSDLIDTTEMYLRTIYELVEEGIVPLRARIAERLHQSGPTVSQTVARMERDGLLTVEGDRHLELTDEGNRLAVRVMRKHRLAERLLTDVIGLEWEHVHAEACRWEHVMSETVERRLVELLDHPTESPYGNPIPGLAELGETHDGEAFMRRRRAARRGRHARRGDPRAGPPDRRGDAEGRAGDGRAAPGRRAARQGRHRRRRRRGRADRQRRRDRRDRRRARRATCSCTASDAPGWSSCATSRGRLWRMVQEGHRIDVVGLTKRFGEVLALDDLTFSVRPGVVTGFLGPNGAGKTTTLRCLLGLVTPTAGSATLDGRRLPRPRAPAPHGRRRARGRRASTPAGPPAPTCR